MSIHFGYPVNLPVAYACLLPCGVTSENIDQHCLCSECASKLWRVLPAHPRAMASCSTDTLVLSVCRHLNKLQLDATGKQHMKTFTFAYERLVKVTTQREPPDHIYFPPLSLLAESLNQLFFAGLLKNVDCQWALKDEGSGIDMLRDGVSGLTGGSHRKLYIKIYPRSSQDLKLTPVILERMTAASYIEESAAHILQTILHEQVHALLRLYCCAGRCTGSREQRKLCAYLYWRTAQFVDTFEIDGQMYLSSTYYGHGPAFSKIFTALVPVVAELTGVNIELSDFWAPNSTASKNKDCWSARGHTLKRVHKALLKQVASGNSQRVTETEEAAVQGPGQTVMTKLGIRTTVTTCCDC